MIFQFHLLVCHDGPGSDNYESVLHTLTNELGDDSSDYNTSTTTTTTTSNEWWEVNANLQGVDPNTCQEEKGVKLNYF